MYEKLAFVNPNVNENRVKNAHSGGFLCKMPLPGPKIGRKAPGGRPGTAHGFQVPQSLPFRSLVPY
jgi:hypothetical protein